MVVARVAIGLSNTPLSLMEQTAALDRDLRECSAAGKSGDAARRGGVLPMGDLQHREHAAVERIAISRALIEGGFLLIRRRRITPPVSIFRTRKIS